MTAQNIYWLKNLPVRDASDDDLDYAQAQLKGMNSGWAEHKAEEVAREIKDRTRAARMAEYKKLKGQLKQLIEASKTPADRITELTAKVEAMGKDLE